MERRSSLNILVELYILFDSEDERKSDMISSRMFNESS